MGITFVNAGTFQSGTGAITPGIPASTQLNDIHLLLVESANEAIATPAGGWAALNTNGDANLAVGTAAAATGTRLAIFWLRQGASAPSAPSVADTGNHTTGIIFAYRGVAPTAYPFQHVNASAPWGGTVAYTLSTSATQLNVPAFTTDGRNYAVVFALASGHDAASTAVITSFNSGNLVGLTGGGGADLRHDETVASGAGGGLALLDGKLASAGSIGTPFLTHAASTTGERAVGVVFAMIPATSLPPRHRPLRVWKRKF